MFTLEQVLLDPIFMPLWIMMIALSVEKLLPWRETYHPLSLFRLIAANMARKVHPSPSRSVAQQSISGSLALITLLTPLIVIVALFVMLAEFPLFFDSLLLVIALQFQPATRHFSKISAALKHDKKSLARHYLSAMVLRETDRLSPMGLGKAAIESLLLRFSYQIVSVLFWFVIAGGVGALTYRLIYECAQAWNTKLARFRFFGKPAATLNALLSWIPVRIAALCIMLGENPFSGLKSVSRVRFMSNNHVILLAAVGGALQCQLGGPAFYDQTKVRLAKVGGNREVRFSDMSRAQLAVYKGIAVLITFCGLGAAIVYAMTQ